MDIAKMQKAPGDDVIKKTPKVGSKWISQITNDTKNIVKIIDKSPENVIYELQDDQRQVQALLSDFYNWYKPYIEPRVNTFKTLNLGQTEITVDGNPVLLDNEMILHMADEIRSKIA